MEEKQTIKLELAKAALTNNAFRDAAELNESVKNLYDWIAEEPEVEVETEQKSSYDKIDIKDVLNSIRKNKDFSSGIPTMIETAFCRNNINTIGDLIRMGRHDFSKCRLMGKKSIRAIDDALEELYGITCW